MRSKLALAAALVLAPLGAGAVTYELTTYYSYSYFEPKHTVLIEGLGDPGGVARTVEDDGTERPQADFGVYFRGGDRDLSGYTFTYHGGLEQAEGDLTFWLFPYKDAVTYKGSSLTFGAGNALQAWNIQGGYGYGLSAFTISSTATRLAFPESEFSNPEAVNGMEVYDREIWEGTGPSLGFHDGLYTTRPGRWEFRRDQYCHSPAGDVVSLENCAPVIAQAPIPASGLLLGSVLLMGGTLLRRSAPAAGRRPRSGTGSTRR